MAKFNLIGEKTPVFISSDYRKKGKLKETNVIS